jgi:hypothetical protein
VDLDKQLPVCSVTITASYRKAMILEHSKSRNSFDFYLMNQEMFRVQSTKADDLYNLFNRWKNGFKV